MDKKTIYVLWLSLLVAIGWIGYTVVSNIFVPTSDTSSTYAKYTTPISGQMYTSAFKKLQALQGNVKVSLSDLSGVTVTPTPIP